MERGAWPDGVETWHNQRVRTPLCPPQPWGEPGSPLTLQPWGEVGSPRSRGVGGAFLGPARGGQAARARRNPDRGRGS